LRGDAWLDQCLSRGVLHPWSLENQPSFHSTMPVPDAR
jgi:hypothetical protein